MKVIKLLDIATYKWKDVSLDCNHMEDTRHTFDWVCNDLSPDSFPAQKMGLLQLIMNGKWSIIVIFTHERTVERFWLNEIIIILRENSRNTADAEMRSVNQEKYHWKKIQ